MLSIIRLVSRQHYCVLDEIAKKQCSPSPLRRKLRWDVVMSCNNDINRTISLNVSLFGEDITGLFYGGNTI